MWPESVTTPISADSVCHLSQIARTASTLAGSTTASIRSCDSLTMISKGSMSASRSGTSATSMSIPTPPAEAISPAEEVRPAAPRSCSETSSPFSSSSRQHSSTFDSSKGSPTWTVGRFASSPSPSSAEARTRGAADPVAAGRRAHQHHRVADPGGGGAHHLLGLGEADAHRVDQAVVLVGLLEVDLAADVRHADRVAVVADPAHRAVEQVARADRVELAEAEAVEDRRSGGRRSRRRRGGSRRPRSPRPGTARPRSGGCGTRP